MQPTPYRLRAAMQFLRNRFHPLATPAARHHACVQDPICWTMAACRHSAYPAFFLFVLCYSRSENLWHLLIPFTRRLPSLFYHHFTNAALEAEREGPGRQLEG